ncbi:unnamed protein product [Soboliphyme baturini]|uniref:Peptidase M23 domain-containing protein n=1 Tax=Soboliphyme baturini TaxID=241478 RepID=A0A183J434_9BILA|nr:unnamed protein product [Soboliphyme baturini]
MYGGRVKKGDVIGYSINHNCAIERYSVFEPYVSFFLFRQGKPIDPTYHMKECFCTGQVCESNTDNTLVYPSFKDEKGYGKGWEIQCPDMEVKPTKAHPEATRMPYIYSPIKGEVLGRFRPRSVDDVHEGYSCSNDGVFILGSDEWKDFTVHLYNVKFVTEPGNQRIEQGQIVGKKMNCSDNEYESVFLEMRYKGKFVNFTDMLLGNDCRLPDAL